MNLAASNLLIWPGSAQRASSLGRTRSAWAARRASLILVSLPRRAPRIQAYHRRTVVSRSRLRAFGCQPTECLFRSLCLRARARATNRKSGRPSIGSPLCTAGQSVKLVPSHRLARLPASWPGQVGLSQARAANRGQAGQDCTNKRASWRGQSKAKQQQVGERARVLFGRQSTGAILICAPNGRIRAPPANANWLAL